MEWDPYQKEILEHVGNLLLCTGRQVGKTTVFAAKAAEYMKNHPKARIIVVSLTEDQAKLIIIMILTYLERHYPKDIKKSKSATNTTKVTLKNNSSVISRPVGNTGDAIRGFTGDVLIIDEAAGMPEMMWAASMPTLASTGGQIWMCSTPRGRTGYFYECYLNQHGHYKVIETNTVKCYEERAVSEDWTEQRRKLAMEFVERQRLSMTTLQFSQEYLGMFLEDLQQFFPDELILNCMKLKRPGSISRGRDYYLGADVGRYGEDPSTFEIFRRTEDDYLFQVESQTTKKTLLTETANNIISLDKAWDFQKIYVDDEGIGIGVFDILISSEQTKRKTEALRNSKKVIDYKNDQEVKMQKELLYMNLMNLMETHKIWLLDDNEIFQSFKSVQFEYVKDKKGKNFMHIFGTNTHIVEGIIRASWCVRQKNIKPVIYWI